jgi:hypothetical protein
LNGENGEKATNGENDGNGENPSKDSNWIFSKSSKLQRLFARNIPLKTFIKIVITYSKFIIFC